MHRRKQTKLGLSLNLIYTHTKRKACHWHTFHLACKVQNIPIFQEFIITLALVLYNSTKVIMSKGHHETTEKEEAIFLFTTQRSGS